MYRRLISGCVLVGFIAAQWAAMPHGHGCGTQLPDNHSAIPHIHLAHAKGSSHKHKHAHTHGSAHGHHHESTTDGRECAPAESGFGSTADHDEDAVYLPTIVSTAANGGTGQCKVLTAPVNLSLVNDVLFTQDLLAHNVASLPQPDAHAPGCALWLALRTLRI